MQLPDHDVVRKSLKRWRDVVTNMTAKDVAKESEKKSKEPFGLNQVTKWESGKPRFSYKRLVEDILPAYRIDDFDTFVDFCAQPSVGDVTVIQADDFSKAPIARGTITHSAGVRFLKNHRTRIDRVVFTENSAEPTSWAPHSGHEFVLVLKGAVICEFAVEETGEKIKHTLTQGMAVAFHSALHHRFFNANPKEDAELVAAKPSKSGTAAGKN